MGQETFKSHEDLAIFQLAFDAAMEIFAISQKFPIEERYSLTERTSIVPGGTPGTMSSQIRRASRSVCANLAEAWRKRRYKAAFIAKLNDCVRVASPKEISEAAETQVWIKFAVKCQYLDSEQGRKLYATYNQVLSGLVNMINHPSQWVIGQ